MRPKNIGDILNKLTNVRQVKPDEWEADCPVPGHKTSVKHLHIKDAGDKALMQCFGNHGHTYEDICQALGFETLTYSDNREPKLQDREIETIYHYTDANGKLFEVVRTRPKGFYQRRPDGKGGYIHDLKGIVPTLYHQDKLRQAIDSTEPIYFVEGEKDADRLWALGLVATTNPMGAGKWRDNYSKALSGADLIIIPDNDGPGRNHANQVAKSCHRMASRIRILELPSECKDVNDWLDNIGDVGQLKQLLAGRTEYELPPDANLPEIVVTKRFLREKTADTIAAVERANIPPQLFERSSHIVRVGHDEFGVPYIETLTESACRGFLERAASYIRVNDKGEMMPLPAPPLDIVRDYMSLPNRNLPALLGVTEIPILRSDGSIVTEPGYDEATHLYYQPAAGLNMPTVQDNPSKSQLEAAVALIQEPITDFPFDSEASRANALAAMVTPIYRPMIPGPAPLCLIDKPQPGTGAGLLSDVIALIATGRPAAMMAPPKSDEECEKRLTSILRHGRAVITIDNMDGYLYFSSLAMILTATTVQTRILGQSEELLLPNRATYIVTGNNVRLAGDLPRRCYLSRMDARDARPWMRDPKSFKYQHLIQWVKENRGELLAAILTMARAWIQAGKPIPEGLPHLGGFEDWTNTVGGVLTHGGLPAFLDNLDFMYSQSDVENTQWENFLAAWQDILGEAPITAAQVVESINEHGILAGALPDAINRDQTKINRSLAHALARRAGVRYPNGLMVTKSDRIVHHAITWQVIYYRQGSKKGELENPNFDDLDTKGELGELPTTQRSYVLKSEKEEKEIYEYGVEPNSLNSPLATKRGELVQKNLPDDIPDYPTHPCRNCGCGDYWLTNWNTWLCSRCHPEPGSNNNAE